MWDVVVDSILDTLKLLPLLFLVYLLIEWIERKTAGGWRGNRLLRGRWAPLIGSTVGLLPQCGFSVIVTNLYAGGLVGLGALISVYLATSDEAIPILLSQPEQIGKILPLLAIKFLYALIVGYLIYLIYDRRHIAEVTATPELPESEEEIGCCHHDVEHKREHSIGSLFLHPLVHSLKIALYIFLINLAFGLLILWIGEEAITGFLSQSVWLQPIVAALIGMIPNCASSVILTQLYLMGGLGLGGAVAGLSVNSGVALAVLFRHSKGLKKNLCIAGLLFVLGVAAGYLAMLLPL